MPIDWKCVQMRKPAIYQNVEIMATFLTSIAGKVVHHLFFAI